MANLLDEKTGPVNAAGQAIPPEESSVCVLYIISSSWKYWCSFVPSLTKLMPIDFIFNSTALLSSDSEAFVFALGDIRGTRAIKKNR